MSTHIERLTTRILHPSNPTPSTEDIFSSALDTLFTDDTQQSHGVPGQSIIYRSPRFGDVYLRIPAHPDVEDGRTLFAHYLWNAGVIAAEAIERGSQEGSDDDDRPDAPEAGRPVESEGGGDDEAVDWVRWDKRFWDVKGRDVLELGAATALPSLICALSDANSVTSTDHPSSPAITTNTIAFNFKVNITDRKVGTADAATAATTTLLPRPERQYTDHEMPDLHHPPVQTTTNISIYGYTWGTTTFYSPDGFGKPATSPPPPKSFDRIIIADCLWMPAQHANLVRTVLEYLKELQPQPQPTNGVGNGSWTKSGNGHVPCALVVAGFHTGRKIVGDFIRIATGTPMGDGKVQQQTRDRNRSDGGDADADVEERATLRAVEIFEVDVEGRRRSWRPSRPTETKEQSRRWCMCAALVRR